MRLTLDHLHLYLLDKGFIEPASLVDGDYIATQMQTRNVIFRVTRRAAPSLFIKQLNSFDPNNTYVLQKDATCLWLIKNHPAFARLSEFVPDYFGFDPEKQVLITEYLAEASNLEDYSRLNQGNLSAAMREEMANILAAYHFQLGADVLESRSVRFFPQQIPWVLNLTDADLAVQPMMFSQTQAPNPVLSTVLGSPVFRQALADIRPLWIPTSLIHGDIKWMNMLVQRENNQEKVKLIDWEIADIGDPVWDVAGIFQGFISNALLYNPAQITAASSLVPGIGLFDLREVWPLCEHFWLQYLTHMTLDGDLVSQALEKTLRYTGARLIQSAIEQNVLISTLQPHSIRLLQASYTILTNFPAIVQYFSAAQPVAQL